jgi:hypothetical protein
MVECPAGTGPRPAHANSGLWVIRTSYFQGGVVEQSQEVQRLFLPALLQITHFGTSGLGESLAGAIAFIGDSDWQHTVTSMHGAAGSANDGLSAVVGAIQLFWFMQSVLDMLKSELLAPSEREGLQHAGLAGELGMMFEWRLNGSSRLVKSRLTEIGDSLAEATAAEIGVADRAHEWKVEFSKLINNWTQTITSLRYTREPVFEPA